jgi:hypothetical protein
MSGEYYLEKYEIPIGIDILQKLERILRHESILLSTGDECERYQVLTYRRQMAHHGAKTYALLDRNTLIDVLAIIRPAFEGGIESCADRGRLGAAMMAFLQCANVVIEPNIALYENPDLADSELRLFRQADNVPAAIYAKLALKEIDYLPTNLLPPWSKNAPTADFSRPLTNTQKFRIALLKIAELDLGSLSAAEKLRTFLQWSFDEFCILAVPTLLAITHFSPHRKSSILQNVRSPDRSRALQSVQNAVWDTLVIQQWGQSVSKQVEENRIWLLCSRDAALKRIAGILHTEENSSEEGMRIVLREWWDAKQRDELAELAFLLQSDSQNPARRANKPL